MPTKPDHIHNHKLTKHDRICVTQEKNMVKQLPANRFGVSLHMKKPPCSKRYETTHQVLDNP